MVPGGGPGEGPGGTPGPNEPGRVFNDIRGGGGGFG